jgi:hypothetical protein
MKMRVNLLRSVALVMGVVLAWQVGALLAQEGKANEAQAEANDQEASPLPEGVVEPLTLEEFQDLLSNSPFRRLMSFSDDLILTGVARLSEGTVVTVYDRRARETYSVSARENAQGWRLIDVSGGRELDDVQARILVGKQELTLRFDQRRLTPESIRRYQPRRVTPAKAPEQPSVEQWLARLDPKLLRNYDNLDDSYKERFRYSFEDYLEEYPRASSELRTITARENLEAVLEQQEKERDTLSEDLESLEVGDPTQ